MRQLVMHSLRMHKVQSISVAVSVALSVMILMTFGLVYGGVLQGADSAEKQGGADVMAVPVDALTYISDTDLLYTGAPAPVYMSDDIVERITSCDGTEKASPQFFSQTLNQSCCSANGTSRLIGIEKETDFVVSALVGDGIMDQFDATSVILGSNVTGVYDGKMRILGNEYKVIAQMAETGTEFDSSIVVDIDLAREMSRNIEGYEHYWEKYGDPSQLVSCVMVDVKDDVDSADGTNKNLTAVKARISLSDTASPLIRSEVVDKAQAQLQSVFLLLIAAAVVMLVVTLLQLFARFFSRVWDRKCELALYRAIGASRADLRKMIIYEMGALVGVGLVVGIVLGFAAQAVLLGVMQGGLAFPYVALGPVPSAALVLAIVVVFVVVSLASIVWPLRQIGHLDPSTAMQQGDID